MRQSGAVLVACPRGSCVGPPADPVPFEGYSSEGKSICHGLAEIYLLPEEPRGHPGAVERMLDAHARTGLKVRSDLSRRRQRAWAEIVAGDSAHKEKPILRDSVTGRSLPPRKNSDGHRRGAEPMAPIGAAEINLGWKRERMGGRERRAIQRVAKLS